MNNNRIRTYNKLNVGINMIESGEAEQAIIADENNL